MQATFVYLASASPRRRELLDQIGVRYRVHAVGLEERQFEAEAPDEFVRRMAAEKARRARLALDGSREPVLAADTAVVVDHRVLGKPRDRDHGLAMLARLSGREHQVLTAVMLVHARREHLRLSTTHVRFRATTPAEREAYWETGEPADKAGAYAVQGLGGIFIERLEGSYSGVVGLPLAETAELLQLAGIDPLARRPG